MDTILNSISNFNDSTKKKSINANSYTTENYNLYTPTPGLNQGNNFNKYQKRINNKLLKKINLVNSREGFEQISDSLTSNISANGLTKQTANVLHKTKINSDQQNTISNLKQQYSNTLAQYETLLGQISGNTKDYISRISPSNPYLNKTVRFTTGHIAYVTNRGVVKYIGTMDIWNSTTAPLQVTQLNIPWDDAWDNVPGITIPTTPPLISGTFMTLGQSLGNEGDSVYVNTLITDSTATYTGCYADNQSTPSTMTFIGGSPPVNSTIVNGNFAQPQIANNTYQCLTWNTTFVPGWNFNCCIVNNSSAWGYPMPYPHGNQCASIQMTGQLWSTWINFNAGVTYTLSFTACGRNCCDGSGIANTINIGTEGETFYTLNPPLNWTEYTTTFTVGTTGGRRLSFIGTWTAGDRSTAIQNIQLNSSGGASSGSYTYDSCKQAAIDSGYKYFALQNVNTSTSTGYCAVSNDSITPTKNGTSYAVTGTVALWSSNTSGTGTGNTATLETSGSLAVLNSSGASIFNTKSTPPGPTTYIGCYKDTGNRAMTTAINGGSQSYDLSGCQAAAEAQNASYFGLQNSSSGTNAQCFVSNSLSQTQQYGPASNCTDHIGGKESRSYTYKTGGTSSGGGWSNAVYSTYAPASNFYLILQDDGNMVVYKGTSPTDNQGTIWSSNTKGQMQKSDPLFTAANSKYGKNWISSGSVLAAGDFVGSTDGSMYLIMQTDGNLVLYTSTNDINCKKMQDGNTGGGEGANALYSLKQVGIPSNMQKTAYIDENSNLNVYPDDNIQLSQKYTKTSNTNCNANDDTAVPAYTNATVEDCKTSCDSSKTCNGIVFDNTNKICYPKTSGVYSTSNWSLLNNVDVYTRDSSPITPSTGITNGVNNISSIQYQNYNTGNPSNSYGLKNISSLQQQQLDQLQTQLTQLSNQIAQSTGTFSKGNDLVNNQSTADTAGLNNYLSDLKKINAKLNIPTTNISNILDDSDIVVLQKNYNYLVWSILAAGTVLVSMNIVKKQ